MLQYAKQSLVLAFFVLMALSLAAVLAPVSATADPANAGADPQAAGNQDTALNSTGENNGFDNQPASNLL